MWITEITFTWLITELKKALLSKFNAPPEERNTLPSDNRWKAWSDAEPVRHWSGLNPGPHFCVGSFRRAKNNFTFFVLAIWVMTCSRCSWAEGSSVKTRMTPLLGIRWRVVWIAGKQVFKVFQLWSKNCQIDPHTSWHHSPNKASSSPPPPMGRDWTEALNCSGSWVVVTTRTPTPQ